MGSNFEYIIIGPLSGIIESLEMCFNKRKGETSNYVYSSSNL